MFPCNCHPPFPRPEPFSPLPRPGRVPDWGKWIRDRLAEKGALLVFPTRASFPDPGAQPNVYEALDTGTLYRWDGAHYQVMFDPESANDVLEYEDRGRFPETGRSGAVYIDTSTNLLYRWDGTGYVLLTSDLSGVESRLADVESKVPAQATAQNQLADKAFVNSSVATNTANYIYKTVGGKHVPFDSLAELQAYEGALTNNDYAFVVGTDAAGNTTYTRYKWNEAAETWAEEYVLNNSSFTAAQWAAISSGITSGLVAKLGALPTAEALAAVLAGKQDTLTFETSVVQNSSNPVRSSGIWAAIWGTASTAFSSMYDWVVSRLGLKRDYTDLSYDTTETVEVPALRATMTSQQSEQVIVEYDLLCTEEVPDPPQIGHVYTWRLDGAAFYVTQGVSALQTTWTLYSYNGEVLGGVTTQNATQGFYPDVEFRPSNAVITIHKTTAQKQVTTEDELALKSGIPAPSTATPAMDGTGAAGSSAAFARGDHVHPTDTSRMAASATGADIAVSGTDATKISAALAGKASKADATLTERFSEWDTTTDMSPTEFLKILILYGDADGTTGWYPLVIRVCSTQIDDIDALRLEYAASDNALRVPVVATRQTTQSAWILEYDYEGYYHHIGIYWKDGYGWCIGASSSSSDGAPKGSVDSTELSWTNDWTGASNSYTLTATRTAPPGYQLGSQTDKPIASEAEAEALRQGKQNALSAQQLANIAAVSDALAFDATHSYAAGDPVVYNGTLYTFTATHTGAWTGTDVSAVDIIARLAGKLDKSGGTMTGDLEVDYNAYGFTLRDRSGDYLQIRHGTVAGNFWYVTYSVNNVGSGSLRLPYNDIIPANVYSLAGWFDESTTYALNSLCTDSQGVLYRCINPNGHTGAWVAADFAVVTIEDVLAALRTGKADVSAIPYTLGTPTVIDTASSEVVEGETVNYGAATLANRTANIVQVTATLDELRITFPAATSGKVRDFGLRAEIGTGSAALAAPALVPIAPTGETIKLENADGTIPELADGTATAKGVALLYFSETSQGVFVVKGEQVEEVA